MSVLGTYGIYRAVVCVGTRPEGLSVLETEVVESQANDRQHRHNLQKASCRFNHGARWLVIVVCGHL